MSTQQQDSPTNYPWHTNSWQQFNRARESNHLPHAILMSGEADTGKLGFALKVVKSLLCENAVYDSSTAQQGACHQCLSCNTFLAGSNPDYLQIDLIEDKQQISVDQIRAMNNFLRLSRSFNTYKVVLISAAERMNQNAANSLLKSLEEPADNSVIILLTSQPSSMLPTIKSRCQLLHLPTPDKQQAIEWLQQQTGKQSQFQQELELAQNKPLAALNVNEELINKRVELLNDIVNIIHEKSSITDIAKKWQKHDRNSLLNWQIGWLYKLLSSQYRIDNAENQELVDNPDKNLLPLKEIIITQQLWDLYDQLLKQKQIVHTSVNPLIFLENMLTLWLQAKHC